MMLHRIENELELQVFDGEDSQQEQQLSPSVTTSLSSESDARTKECSEVNKLI